MDGKRTVVTLVREVDGSPTDFEVGHAERILSLSRSGWALPKDSEYVLKDGALIKRSKKGDKGAEKA